MVGPYRGQPVGTNSVKVVRLIFVLQTYHSSELTSGGFTMEEENAMKRLTIGAVGFVLLIISTVAIAQGSTSGSSTPVWVTLLIGVFMLVLTAYMRGLEGSITRIERRVEQVETEQRRTNNSLLGDYHDKEELEKAIRQSLEPVTMRIAHVETGVNAIHKRLDRQGFAKATGQHQATNFGD